MSNCRRGETGPRKNAVLVSQAYFARGGGISSRMKQYPVAGTSKGPVAAEVIVYTKR